MARGFNTETPRDAGDPTFRYKLTIAYDGTEYNGWQVQPNGLTIQGHLQEALLSMFQTFIPVTGAGRTDSGVHAKAQVAHLNLTRKPEPFELIRGLNAHLPEDIRVTEASCVDQSFHARYSAKGKTYLYRIHTGHCQSPFQRKYATHFSFPLKMELIKKALPLFEGKKDFHAFANEVGPKSAKRNPIKHLKKLSLLPTDDGFDLEFYGDGFLYKMVRNITGTLLDIGREKISIDEIQTIFQSRDRKKAGKAAPPEGLTLISVEY